MPVKRGVRGVEGHSTVVVGECLVVYGGRVDDREVASDVFCMKHENSEWKELRTGGLPPMGRCYHTANVHAGRMVVFGGLTSIGWDDVHYNHYNVFVSTNMIDPYERQVGDAKFKDTLNPIAQAPGEPYCYHELDLMPCPPVWTTPETRGDVPEPRSHHTAAVHEGALYIYGGYNTHASQRLTDERQKSLYSVFAMDLGTKVWRRMECRESIPPILWGHCGAICDGVYLTLGGVDLLNTKEEGYICGWHVATQEWRWIIHTDDKAMGPRAMHTMVHHEGRLITFGGTSNVASTLHDSVRVFDLAAGTWLAPRCTGEGPTARRNHTAVVHNGRMVVTGGIDEAGFRSNRSYTLDLATWTWTALSTTFNDVPATSVVKSGDGYGPSDDRARQRLRRLHAKRKKEKEDLLTVEGGNVKRLITLEKIDADDGAPWEVDLSDASEGKPCVITAVRGAAELYLAPGMRLMQAGGVPLRTSEQAQEALAKNPTRLRVVVEQREEDIPPSPPSSDDGGASTDGEAPPAPPDGGPRSDPARWTQTPEVPRLSRDAALIHQFAFNQGAAHAPPAEASPHINASDELHTLDYNVYTASAVDPRLVKYRPGQCPHPAPQAHADPVPPPPAARPGRLPPNHPLAHYVTDFSGAPGPRVAVVAPGEEAAYHQDPTAPSFRPDLGSPEDAPAPRMPRHTPPAEQQQQRVGKPPMHVGKYGYVEALPKIPERPHDEVAAAVKRELSRTRPELLVTYKQAGGASGDALPVTHVDTDATPAAYASPPRGADHIRLDDERLTAERTLGNAASQLEHLRHLGERDVASAAPATVDPAQSLRAWNAFPSAPVKHQTISNRARYMSPSVIKLGMTDQLAISKPAALAGQFNGSHAASHPYGRSIVKDHFNIAPDPLAAPGGSPPPPEDARAANAQAADRYLTTVSTAIPAGLGPISAAAYLTGLYEKDGAYEKNHPEVLLARFPMDVRNAAAAAYRGQWEHWSDRERLHAVRRYADYQISRARETDDLPPVLPPPQAGAEGLNNLPHYVAHPSNLAAP